MKNNQCDCPKCLHRSCPLPDAEPPYDELTQQIDDNILSVRIPKPDSRFQGDDLQKLQEKLSFDFNCADEEGEKCKTGCSKVYVIPGETPPPKDANEEMLWLRSVTHTEPGDDLWNMLELEFRGSRNYNPLPKPGPPPPIIVPKVNIKSKKKRKNKAKK